MSKETELEIIELAHRHGVVLTPAMSMEAQITAVIAFYAAAQQEVRDCRTCKKYFAATRHEGACCDSEVVCTNHDQYQRDGSFQQLTGVSK